MIFTGEQSPFSTMSSILPVSVWPSSVRPGTITFVRHGQKNGGGFSADLTEQGRVDAEAAGRAMVCKADLFLASPSPRAVSTAECIRKGNGSGADIIVDEQLAEPGLGLYTEFGPAMRAFLLSILNIVEGNNASVVIATTHNYVLDYVDALTGSRDGMSDLLSGITLDLAFLKEIAEKL